MKTIGVILILFGILFASSRGAFRIYIGYQYQNEIEENWDLSVRASTLSQKSEYLNKFVSSLEQCHLEGVNSALFFQTAETDFSENMKALKSLQGRLTEIAGMDESSFAYQTALHQITAQEQGEAEEMLNHLEECWTRSNYYTIWNPIIGIVLALMQILSCILGFAIVLSTE